MSYLKCHFVSIINYFKVKEALWALWIVRHTLYLWICVLFICSLLDSSTEGLAWHPVSPARLGNLSFFRRLILPWVYAADSVLHFAFLRREGIWYFCSPIPIVVLSEWKPSINVFWKKETYLIYWVCFPEVMVRWKLCVLIIHQFLWICKDLWMSRVKSMRTYDVSGKKLRHSTLNWSLTAATPSKMQCVPEAQKSSFHVHNLRCFC